MNENYEKTVKYLATTLSAIALIVLEQKLNGGPTFGGLTLLGFILLSGVIFFANKEVEDEENK